MNTLKERKKPSFWRVSFILLIASIKGAGVACVLPQLTYACDLGGKIVSFGANYSDSARGYKKSTNISLKESVECTSLTNDRDIQMSDIFYQNTKES